MWTTHGTFQACYQCCHNSSPLLLFLYYALAALFLLFTLALLALSLREYFHMLALMQMPVCPKISYAVAASLVLVAYLGGKVWLPLALSGSIMILTLVPYYRHSAVHNDFLRCYIVCLASSLSAGV